MATDVARLALQIDVTGAGRAKQALAGLQDGSIRATRATNQLAASTTRLNSVARSSRSSFRLQKGALQQAGFQIQDFAVQVGSGQSALVAFGQQGSQLAGILGPGGALLGAVIAIGSVVGGIFARSMMNGAESTDTLSERIGALRENVDEMTEAQIRGLRVEFFAANRDRAAAIQSERENIRDLTRELTNLKEAERAAEEQALMSGGMTPQLAELQSEIQKTSRELQIAKGSLDTYYSEADNAAVELKELIEGNKDAGDSAETAADKIKEMVEAAEQQAATIGLSARATATYEAALAGANAEQILAIDAAYRRVEAHKAEVEQQKRLQEQYKITAANDPMLQQVAAQDRGQGIIEDLRKEAEATRQSLDARYAAQVNYKDKVARINDMMRLGVIESEQQKNQLLLQARTEYLEALKAKERGYWAQWMQSAERNLTDFNQLSQNVAGNFSSGFGNALESVIFDFKSVGEAADQMLLALMRGTINTLGQMAAQWLVYQAVQAASAGTAATAAAGAMTAEAAAKQQMAALGAFASTAAIPVVGPAAAPAAAGAALAATSPFVAAIAGLTSTMAASAGAASFDGGGYTGKGSRSGGLDGKGGFMAMMHPQETVIDHTKGQGMGGGTVININNAPQGTRTEERTDSKGRQVVDIFMADMASGGPMSKSIQGTYGLKRQGR